MESRIPAETERKKRKERKREKRRGRRRRGRQRRGRRMNRRGRGKEIQKAEGRSGQIFISLVRTELSPPLLSVVATETQQ